MFKKIFSKKTKSQDDSDDEENQKLEKNEEQKEKEEGEVQKPIEPEQPQQETLIEMKKGDYNVHILIEEVKNLISIEENKPPVPRVKMTVFGKEQRTSKMKKPCDNFVFNEHFYFDKTNLTVEMLDSEKILIEVYDNNHTKRKDYFGIYELDFGYVYGRPEHTLRNIWIGLSNSESDDLSQIRGYLKLSVSVLNDSDDRVELEAKDSELGNCIIPIEIKMKYKQISFHFFKGEQFPDMDAVFSEKKTGRRCDGYIEMKYMGIMRKTKTVEMKNEVIIWNQTIDIPATYPCVSQKICMLVKDEDIGGDDIVGSYEFNINDIYAGKYYNYQFINIYGSPLNKKGGIYDQMNYNAEIGSRWNGRILMRCDVKDVDSPIARVSDIKDKSLTDEVNKYVPQVSWVLLIRVASANFLPELNRDYEIKICYQDKSVSTTKRSAINGSIDFNETIYLTFNSVTQDKDNLSDVFIYLVDHKQSSDKKNVCFQRIKASEFHLNKDVFYIKLLPDPVINKVKSMMKSGILKCKICLYNSQTEQQPDMVEFESCGGGPQLQTLESGGFNYGMQPTQLNFCTIIAVIYMSKGLVAAESNGTSDPFVSLTLGNQTKKTSVKNNTMNGVWNELLEFTDITMDLQDQTTWPVFLLNVYDYNKIKSDVPLGYNYLWLSNTHYVYNKFELINPKWHNLFLPKSNKKQGQILMSFYIFDKNIGISGQELLKNIKYKPQTTLYNFEISVLGLRELKPLGIIGVKKPFIKFDLNSLNVTGEPEDEHTPIKTVPVSGGANPTINTVIQFQTKLPLDNNFMPELQCEVYDNILSGLSNSLLGVFSIDLKKIIKRTQAQVVEDINQAKKNMGMAFARQLILGQLSNSNSINNNALEGSNNNINNIDTGMKESNIENSNDNIISTKNDQELLHISKTLNQKDIIDSDDENEKFLEEDENKLDDNNKGEVNINNTNLNNMVFTIAQKGQKLTARNTLKLGGDFIKNNLNDSNYFVVYPNLKPFKIPGYSQSIGNNEAPNNLDNNQKVQKELFIEDPDKIPDPQLFFKIGYLLKYEEGINPQESTKHYRRIFRCPLENVDVPEFSMKTPFNIGKIKRGKYVDKKSETGLFDAMKDIKSKIIYRFNNKIGEHTTVDNRSSVGSEDASKKGFLGDKSQVEKSYGKFKGLVRVTENSLLREYEKTIEKSKENSKITQTPLSLKNYNKYNDLRQKLLNKKEVIIRVYILELNELAKKDLLSESDPYIKLYLNDKLIVNEKKNHHNDAKNCKWYKHYDIAGEMPGSSILKIEVLDYDDILSDDLIGSTVIDLEDRYFNCDWQGLIEKPVEVRPLLHSDLNGAQGQIYLWLEIFDASIKASKIPWKISPEPITEFQVRFIVWETEDMEMMDIEGTSDIYVIAYFDQEEIQKTDVHYRCQNGAASFNWRILLPLKLPVQRPKITLQVYDKDLFASDDYISGATLNLKDLMTVPKYLEMPIKFTRDYYNGLTEEGKKIYGDIQFMDKKEDEEGIKFWVQCYKGKKEAAGEGEQGGRVLCSVEILPKNMAELEPVGKGREEPNVNPYLPPPVGRLEFTLNPFKMVNQCVGPKFRRKCYCICLLCLVVAYLIYALPTMVTKIIF